MTTTKKIGPKMEAVADFVAKNLGCSKLRAAEHVGPHGSRRFGYRTVDRAIAAGLIEARPGPRKGSYALFPTET